MKPLIPTKYYLPLGMLLLSAGLIINHLFNVPDFVSGFLIGAGIGVSFLSLVKSWYKKGPTEALKIPPHIQACRLDTKALSVQLKSKNILV